MSEPIANKMRDYGEEFELHKNILEALLIRLREGVCLSDILEYRFGWIIKRKDAPGAAPERVAVKSPNANMILKGE